MIVAHRQRKPKETQMRTQKSMIATILTLTVALAAVLSIPAGVSWAQSDELVTEKQILAKTADAKSERMEGAWIVTISPVVPPGVPPPPSFRAFGSCARGGAIIGSDARRAASKQQGTWMHLHGNEFAW